MCPGQFAASLGTGHHIIRFFRYAAGHLAASGFYLFLRCIARQRGQRPGQHECLATQQPRVSGTAALAFLWPDVADLRIAQLRDDFAIM